MNDSRKQNDSVTPKKSLLSGLKKLGQIEIDPTEWFKKKPTPKSSTIKSEQGATKEVLKEQYNQLLELETRLQKKLSIRMLAFMGLLAAALMVGIFVNLVFRPMTGKVQQLGQAYQNISTQVRGITTEIATLSAKQKAKELEEEKTVQEVPKTKLDDYEKADQEEFISSIVEMATKRKLVLVRAAAKNEIGVEFGFQKVELEFELLGEYSHLGELLFDIDQLPVFFVIRRTELSAADSVGQVQMSIAMDVYTKE